MSKLTGALIVVVIIAAVAGVAYFVFNNNNDMIVGTWGADPQLMSSTYPITWTFNSDNTFEAKQVNQNGQTFNSMSGTWKKLADNQYQLSVGGESNTIIYDPSTGILNNAFRKQGSSQSTSQSQSSIIGTWRQVGTIQKSYSQCGGNFDRYLSDSIAINSDGSITKVILDKTYTLGQWEQASDGQYLFYPSSLGNLGIWGKGTITIHNNQLWIEGPGYDLYGQGGSPVSTIFERN